MPYGTASFLKMNLKNKILFSLTKKILEKNKKFHNIHLGETCYLFGNGASLKCVDLGRFSDKISIGCNHLVLHKDFQKLDCRYYTIAEPFFAYPIYRNPYSEKWEPNYMGMLFKKAINHQSSISIFTNVSNLGGFWGDNYFYFYHFGKREISFDAVDLTSSFSFLQGALFSMIGLAIYMGFKKAILVGCDYTFFPVKSGHFYGRGIRLEADELNQKPTCNPFLKISEYIQLVTVTDNSSKSKLMDSIEYRTFTGVELLQRENYEVVEARYLEILKKAHLAGQYTNSID